MVSQLERAWNDYLRGRCLEMGDARRVDLAEAARQYRRAALRGLAEAQHALAFLYATGQGVRRDDTLALRWFEVAAEQGHVAAQHNLGVMLAEGRGAAPDELEAARWCYRAALGGSAESRCWLEGRGDDGEVMES